MDGDNEASARRSRLTSLFAALNPSSSSESEEEEAPPPPKPERRGLLDAVIDIGLLKPDAGMRIPLEDQKRMVDENFACGNRRFALEKNNKDAQARLIRDQEDFIISLLAEMKEKLQPVVPLTLPSFLDVFRQIAISQMRKVENMRLIPIGKDLYIMAGMMAGLFRADEEFRGRFSYLFNYDFKMYNFHQEAETFLINEKLQETDRRQSEKRKMADDEAEERKTREAEERRRVEEEEDQAIERELERLLDIRNFDTARFQTLMLNGWPEDEAQAQCEKEARERRIESQREVEVRSSPPRSEVDPNDVALDLDAFHLEEDNSLYTPLPCPAAEVRPSDYYAMLGAPALDDLETEDMEIDDDSAPIKERGSTGEPDQQEQQRVDHGEGGRRKSRRDYLTHHGAQELEERARQHRHSRPHHAAAQDDGLVRRLEDDGEEQREERIVRDAVHEVDGEEQQADFHEEREDRGDYVVVSPPKKTTNRQQKPLTPPPLDTPPRGPRTRSQERRREEEARASLPQPPVTRSRSASLQPSPAAPIARQKEREKDRRRERSEERVEREDPVPYDEPECVEMEDIMVEEEEEEAYDLPNVDAYKPWLEQMEMAKMVKEREAKEQRRLRVEARETPSEWEEIDCGQETFEDHVSLGNFDGAVIDENPNIRVDIGVRPIHLKSAMRNTRGAPALLTDLHADKLRGDKKEQQRLINIQRSYSVHPRKKVVFRAANDPQHQIRCYDMVADQEPLQSGLVYDVTDDGYDKFHLTKSMPFHTQLLRASNESYDMKSPYKHYLATIEQRKVAGDCHTQNQIGSKRLTNRYITGPIVIPVTKRQDVIYTRESALMQSGDEKKEEFEEFAVSHRDYKVLLAMKPMEDKFIAGRWLRELRLYVENAFGCELSWQIGAKSVANSGLSHLVFADSLLDRVNTYRFPQSYFIIHQHPLTLSSSFRVLCDEIPIEKLMNMEWFIFAYGFDEIIFEGEVPEKAAERVVQHVLATMQLYYNATQLLQSTHRCLLSAKFRVFKLPTHNMDVRIQSRIKQFNDHLVEAETKFTGMATQHHMEVLMHHMFSVVDWETPAIVGDAIRVGKNDVQKRIKLGEKDVPDYRYNCIDSFVQSTHNNCNMRTARPMRSTDNTEYHRKRLEVKVHGLSEEEHNRFY